MSHSIFHTHLCRCFADIIRLGSLRPSGFFAGLLLWCSLGPGLAGSKPNVLLIAVDDLRPELGCYGASHIHSPNIDAFAASGLRFERAYCQQAVCNPSRTSLMTGMRPDSIGVTGNHRHFRANHPNVVTLPQHFKHQGYHSLAIGKIYHGVFPDGASKTVWDTMGDPESWSVPAIRFGPRYYYTEEGIAAAKQVYQAIYKPSDPSPDDWTKKLVFGPATEAPEIPDGMLYDGKVADAAVTALRQLKQSQQAFFLALGFIKPHSPYVAPKKYFDLYESVSLPSRSKLPTGAPHFSGHGSGELRRYTDQPKTGPIPKENQQRVRQAYFACVSYIDAQIGRVLDELDRSGLSENTIVILYGDHGYHLGEHGLWGKTTNFELDTRVPLIVRVPGMKTAGESTSSLVELIDLYPTLAELAGLTVSDHLEGESFVSILNDSTKVIKTVAFSQYPRSGGLMGYSMRTSEHRLTQWVHVPSGNVRATELYEYQGGVLESENIAGGAPDLVRDLSARIRKVSGAMVTKKTESPVPVASVSSSSVVFSFEPSEAGPFKELESVIGRWTSEDGQSLIDDRHAKTGRHCLQLTGGEGASVSLELSNEVDTTGELVFSAERWTKRTPFTFRIEKLVGDDWTEILNGDDDIRVGRAFLSQVRVPLGDARIEGLRFTVTSPPNTGILIDDIQFAPSRPQEIVDVEIVPLTLPALRGAETSPLLKLRVDTIGNLAPLAITALRASLAENTHLSDLDLISVYRGNSEGLIGRALATLKGDELEEDNLRFSWSDDVGFLSEGGNYLWIAGRLKEDADIDHQLGVNCQEVSFSNRQTVSLEAPPSVQRMGVALRKAGDGGVHTYRIPGLATTNHGTLIGVYDVRRRSGGDLPGDIEVGMSRSTDGGRTWEPMKVIMDMGDDPRWSYDGIGDPAVLVDRNTGTIWVAATWSHGERSWRGSGPGLSPDETGQLMLVRSDDDGVSWSTPINITSQVKKPEWCFILQGPGKGITMRDGTIVFAAQYQDPPELKRLPHSTIIFSKDHGKTWEVGNGAFDDTTEAQVIEIEPSVLMLNCRYNRSSLRVVMTTRDMGKTWQKHSTSERSLIEPRSCMASLIDVDRELGGDRSGRLLFSNPDSRDGRDHMMIKASFDRGLTWPKEHRLLLDEGSSAGYSCLSMIDEKTVGILYEGSQAHMTFQRIPLSEFGEKRDASERFDLKTRKQSLKLPQIFGSHMILQADAAIPIWGTAGADAKVTIALGDEVQQVIASESGDWSVRLLARKATSVPVALSIESGGERVQYDDVLIGEVWICAGQSNMEWPLSQSVNGQSELTQAARPNLRLLHLVGAARGNSGSYSQEQLSQLKPERFFKGEWKTASAESARGFSAVGWYFGRQLHEELNVPVGLISLAVGGTPTEAWIPRKALEDDPNCKGLVVGNWLDNERLGRFCRDRGEQNLLVAMQDGERIPGDDLGPNHSFKPGFMWSAGIERLIPFGIRGVVWYQGESNAESRARVEDHERLFPMLVNVWRGKWGQGSFPFLYVQLPGMNRSEWPWFREGQRRMQRELENVGMATTIDTGHRTNVHPPLKKPVGQRLALWALGDVYQSDSYSTFSGPVFDVAKREGGSILVSFTQVGEGLTSNDGKPIRFLELCGEDGVFFPAHGKISGKDLMRVSSPMVARPHDLRYAWLPYPNPSVNLFNSEGLPAAPFSTETAEAQFVRRSKAQNRPNILFVVSEDNGAHLGCYGEQQVHTPHLDSLASEGVRYTRAYVPYSVCSPSRAAFLTGLYPRQTGHIGLATHRFSMYRDFKTIPAYFQAAGYYTGFLGKTHINPEGLVEDYVDHRAIRNSNFGKTISIETYAREARLVMDQAAEREKPFMLIVNYADAHRRFVRESQHGFPTRQVDEAVAPFPWIGSDLPHLRDELRDYFNCMNRLDEGIGMVLDQLDETEIRDNTMISYISDHGADFPRGKGSVYENGTRIPMIIHYPKSFSMGKVEEGMVSTLDLVPTMLRAARIQVPESLPGMALQDIDSGVSLPRKFIHTFTTGSSPNLLYLQFGIRDGRYKLIYNPDRALNRLAKSRYDNSQLPKNQRLEAFLYPPEYELYDLQQDPDEWQNLAGSVVHLKEKTRLLAAMREFQVRIKDPFADPENLAALIAEQKEYQQKPYKVSGFRWPHLQLFEQAE